MGIATIRAAIWEADVVGNLRCRCGVGVSVLRRYGDRDRDVLGSPSWACRPRTLKPHIALIVKAIVDAANNALGRDS
jgi:hypothetical protein